MLFLISLLFIALFKFLIISTIYIIIACTTYIKNLVVFVDDKDPQNFSHKRSYTTIYEIYYTTRKTNACSAHPYLEIY